MPLTDDAFEVSSPDFLTLMPNPLILLKRDCIILETHATNTPILSSPRGRQGGDARACTSSQRSAGFAARGGWTRSRQIHFNPALVRSPDFFRTSLPPLHDSTAVVTSDGTVSAARTLSVSAQYINSARRIQGRHSRASIVGSEAWMLLDSLHVITTPPPSLGSAAKQSRFRQASVSSHRVLGRFKPGFGHGVTDTPRETCAGVTVRGFTLVPLSTAWHR